MNDRKTAKIHREVEQAIMTLYKHGVIQFQQFDGDAPHGNISLRARLTIDYGEDVSGADDVRGIGLVFYNDHDFDDVWAININKKSSRLIEAPALAAAAKEKEKTMTKKRTK
jgi:hypothetical protein